MAFLRVKNKVIVMRRILEIALENNYTLVAEFDDDLFFTIVNEYIESKDLTQKVCNMWSNAHIKAFSIKKVSDYFVANIFAYVSVLWFFEGGEDEERILLIADDLHKQCFSCSDEFYKKFAKRIEEHQLSAK